MGFGARITFIVVVVCFLIAAAGVKLPLVAAPPGSPWGANYFPNVTLIAQDGKTYRFYDELLKNKIVVVNFIYTQCGDSCPLETAKLRNVQRILGDRVGKDIFFYSISIDPKRDTPEQLADYAEAYNAGPGWYFLTGKKEDVDLIRKKFGVQNRPGTDPLTGHSTSLVLGNEADGQWMLESTLDDPRYIAVMIGDWLDEWRHTPKGESFAKVPKLDDSVKDAGAYLFKTRCSVCHTVGGGDGIGPDLAGVTARRSPQWLEHFIAEPDKMVAQKDKIALALFERYKPVRMPNLRLGPKDTAALIAFLEKERATRASVK